MLHALILVFCCFDLGFVAEEDPFTFGELHTSIESIIHNPVLKEFLRSLTFSFIVIYSVSH